MKLIKFKFDLLVCTVFNLFVVNDKQIITLCFNYVIRAYDHLEEGVVQTLPADDDHIIFDQKLQNRDGKTANYKIKNKLSNSIFLVYLNIFITKTLIIVSSKKYQQSRATKEQELYLMFSKRIFSIFMTYNIFMRFIRLKTCK